MKAARLENMQKNTLINLKDREEMEKKQEIVFCIDSMNIGGAERVVSVLAREFVNSGLSVSILMLYKREILHELPKEVKVHFIDDIKVESKHGKCVQKWFEIHNYVRSRFFIPLMRRMGLKEKFPKWNETAFYFYSTYAIPYREYLKEMKECTAFGFLIRSNIALCMAAKRLNIKTVFCERNNPIRTDIPKNIMKLRDRYCMKSKNAVFQTEEQKNYYTSINGVKKVIPNPLKGGLPQRYIGERRKEVVNFCRLSSQKNLKLLIDAFVMLYKDYPDYSMRIYGDGEEKENLLNYINEIGMQEKIIIEQFTSNIHEQIVDAKMFVSTSDYEGLSNSMLEALAIGLPSICTDCDGGGARMVIKDGINGLLVPKRDVKAVYNAMKRIVEDNILSEKMSENAVQIREELSVNKIVEEWKKMI